MPCKTYDTDREEYEADRRRDQLDEVTRHLCTVLGMLQTTSWLPPEIQAWWKAHQEADRKRLEAEAKDKKHREVEASVEAFRQQKMREMGL